VTEVDLLDSYEQASAWTLGKVRGATERLDSGTPCDDWDVRNLLNHMLDTQHYFTGAARGEDVSPPSPTPPELLGEDPVQAFERSRTELLRSFGAPGVIEKTGPMLGIALADQLLHGWDLAVATGQDATMPEGLPSTAYDMIHGRFTDEQRKGVFKPALTLPANASTQDQLLAYTGRQPAES
jgi:uncharacterized protein (TIGR03086 family)